MSTEVSHREKRTSKSRSSSRSRSGNNNKILVRIILITFLIYIPYFIFYVYSFLKCDEEDSTCFIYSTFNYYLLCIAFIAFLLNTSAIISTFKAKYRKVKNVNYYRTIASVAGIILLMFLFLMFAMSRAFYFE